jgi:hypothetical protein
MNVITEVKMTKLWRFLAISIVGVVCLGLVILPGVGVSAAEPASGKVTFLLPIEVMVTPGDSFSVDVIIYNPHQVNMCVAMVAVRSDVASLLTVNDVTPGDWPLELLEWIGDGEFNYDAAGNVGIPSLNTTIVHCTVNFTANATAEGVTTVRFVTDGGEWGDTSCAVKDASPEPQDVLDWACVQNMTVKIGTFADGLPPRISANPSSLTFSGNVGEANPPDQTLEVCNSGNGTVDWSLTDNTAWLSETPTSGSLGEDECEDVTVSVDVTGMEAGDYSATITITGSGEVQVPVSLHIGSAAPVGPANLSASSLSISPQQIQPGEEVTISINVANTGGETGSYNAVLYINDVVEDNQTVSVAGGTSKNVIFTVSKTATGVYDVSLAGQSGQFEVVGGGGVDGGLSTGGIIAIVVVVVALIVALFFILRGRRKGT